MVILTRLQGKVARNIPLRPVQYTCTVAKMLVRNTVWSSTDSPDPTCNQNNWNSLPQLPVRCLQNQTWISRFQTANDCVQGFGESPEEVGCTKELNEKERESYRESLEDSIHSALEGHFLFATEMSYSVFFRNINTFSIIFPSKYLLRPPLLSEYYEQDLATVTHSHCCRQWSTDG